MAMEYRLKPNLFVLTVFFTLVVFLFGGGGSEGLAQPSGVKPEQAKLAIGLPVPAISFLPTWVADQIGFFKEEGFTEIKILAFRGDADVLQALAAGTVDINVSVGSQVTYVTLQDIMRQDFIRVAYAKGRSRSGVVTGHALKNAAIPVMTTMGASLRYSLAIQIVLEPEFHDKAFPVRYRIKSIVMNMRTRKAFEIRNSVWPATDDVSRIGTR
jgi:hypothetical protein